VVLVVSPPVVRASLTTYGPAETRMIAGEFQAAASFHSRNVFLFDLYQQMANYLQKHHQSIDVYAGDNWHPNSTGHALAGNLLFNDLVQAFGTSPITFQAAPAGGRTAAAVPASIRSAPNQGKTGGR
ncbi:MAG: hypothetical protein IRY83_17765, partial [Chloroflexi bacterium]|nr:hypothetical protein [Chloroflexota bacterium]